MKNIVIYKDKRVYSAFPDIEKLQNGHLVVVFREAPPREPYTHVDSEARNVLVRSKDTGKTWGEKVIVSEDTSADGCFENCSVVQLKNGTLLVNSFKWHMVKEDPFNHWIEGTFIACSSDNGYSWQEPVIVKAPSDFKDVSTLGSILELPNGELLIPLYTQENGYPGKRRAVSFVLKSLDMGKTWGNLRMIALDPFENLSFEEPALCYLPSGKILCMMRQELGLAYPQGYLYQSESLDNGETWSPPKRIDIWGFPANLLPLRDGKLLCTYGYRRPPYGVRACLSYDEGKTWDLRNELVLRSDGFYTDLGYPSSIELEDNQILTVYYFHTQPTTPPPYDYFTRTDGIRFIAGTFYSVK